MKIATDSNFEFVSNLPSDLSEICFWHMDSVFISDLVSQFKINVKEIKEKNTEKTS